LVNEELYYHEGVFDFNPFQFGHLVEGIIYFFSLLGKQLNLLLNIFQLVLNDGSMA
jgi:hypothetical protein